MSWLRLSDDFVDDPAILELGDLEALAGWTYLRLVSYAARHLTDGEIPAGILRREDAPAIEALVRVGLLERRGAGAYLPRFIDQVDENGVVVALGHHPARAFVEQRRATRAKAGSKGGRASAHARDRARAGAGAQANSKQVLQQPASKAEPLSLTLSPSLVPVTLNPDQSLSHSRAQRARREGEIEVDEF